MKVEYSVVDRSLVYGPLKRLVWTPMLRCVPLTMSANTLTLIGSLMCATASTLLFVLPLSRFAWGAASVLYFLYLCVDNLDGMQARRTGGGTPLGEVLDHWLDSVNGVFMFMAGLRALDIGGWRALTVMALASLSFSFLYWEHRIRGQMVLGALGTAEGIVAVSAFCVAGALISPSVLVHTPVVLSLGGGGRLFCIGECMVPVARGLRITAADAFFYFVLVNLLFTVAAPIRRVRGRAGDIVTMLVVNGALLLWGCFGAVPSILTSALFVLLTPLTAGRLLIARVTNRTDFEPDRLLRAGVLAGAAVSLIARPGAIVETVAMALLVAYAGGQVTYDFVRSMRGLSSCLRAGETLAVLLRIRA